MKKGFKIIASIISLSLSFFICQGYMDNICALEQDNKLELLIENKKEQDFLKEQINKIEEQISNKNQTLNEVEDNSKDVNSQVVTVSFIQESDLVENKNLALETSIKNDIINLKANIEKTQIQLENSMIKNVKLEKLIEEETQTYLKNNNIQYKQGIWPLLSYKTISSSFGYRIHPITGEHKLHRGIDIPAPQNTDILASDDGIVIFSGNQAGYGNLVKIKHFDGKKTVYAHNTLNEVKEGDIVTKGQIIAKVGSTGNSTGNHVHFETIINEENINPLNAVTK